MNDFDKASENFGKILNKLTPEEIEKYFPKDTTPKGWVSIENDDVYKCDLPKCTIDDLLNRGYTVVKVKDKDGNEYNSYVTDHHIWYYRVKEQGITHWWND